MSLSRREFLTTFASAGSAMLAGSHAFAAPYQASVRRGGGAATEAVQPNLPPRATEFESPIVIPSTMPMGSGAPLGGIGTGFVEIRADGCFYEWQIFNSGAWAQGARSTTAPPPPGPQYLRFMLRARKASEESPQLRRLYLRSDENNLYTLPFAQDVESIDYYAWFPMTGLCYNDPTLPVRVTALAFSPFIPGKARESATPGFHIVYSLENISNEVVEASIAGILDNPLASALPNRQLTNSISEQDQVTSLFLQTAAQSDFPSGIGNMCLSVTGGEHSYISGTFQEYASSECCRWETPRLNYMLIGLLQEYFKKGQLPNAGAVADPTPRLPTLAQIDALPESEARRVLKELSADALLARVFSDAHDPDLTSAADAKELLREVHNNLLGKKTRPRLTWGTGALASSVRIAPGQRVDLRFTLSWFFPHHLTSEGREMGHAYDAWFHDAADVNQFLCRRYDDHRKATEIFANTLADTSLGNAMAFSWSGQISTLVTNTWWTKDGSYAIWEGLGCCGLSTTDVDYQGSFPIVALFPALKLSQMKQTIGHQNNLGQVPHNFAGDVDRVDAGFSRVDMNPQFVMMVYRDYLWTGDEGYLAFMWPHVQKAMAFTESLDTNDDGLPDHDTAIQTYDQWRMRGTPAYIASLWIGALRAAIQIALAAGKPVESGRWSDLLTKASAAFDDMLFNGQYYSLWVDGANRDELCMTDQISGEWFTHMIGLPTTISEHHLDACVDNIFKFNFNPEFGLHNATAPKRGASLLALDNLQAGGLWSGIEFAFASFLIARGRYTDGIKVVEAIHRRYLRAGQPWSHVECGGHYSRPMSSWATLLAATGFKPDIPGHLLTVVPTAPGDFHAPWVMASGFGTISRAANTLSISCANGTLEFKSIKLNTPVRSVRIGTRVLEANARTAGNATIVEFPAPVALHASETLNIHQ